MLGSQSKMAADVDAGYEQSLQSGIRRAQTLLDKLQFTESQTAYQEVLRQAAPETAPRAPGPGRRPTAAAAGERATVAAVSGLAESFARQSRNLSTSSEEDQRGSVPWLRLNIQVCFAVKAKTQ